METLPATCEKVHETSDKWIASGPITFDEYLELCGPKDYTELVDGVIVEQAAVDLDQQMLFGWLVCVLGGYIEARNLGILLGSRTAIKIGTYRGRMPDLLFVRRERRDILQQKAPIAAPDMVMEIITPYERPSEVIALELDYTSIGVEEIVFIDQKKRRVHILRKQGKAYAKEVITEGTLKLQTLPELTLETKWFFSEPRPTVRETLAPFLDSQS